jgi:hypothetical protein
LLGLAAAVEAIDFLLGVQCFPWGVRSISGRLIGVGITYVVYQAKSIGYLTPARGIVRVRH